MTKKKQTIAGFGVTAIILLVLLAACANIQLPGITSSATQQSQQNPAANFANQPVESKLAIGLLKLEGTDQAVTADQAKNLLPLWKAVKTMSASSTVSGDEMTALYQQIQDSLTASQVQAIKDLNLTQADLQALMQTYGVQMQAPPQGGATPNASDRATRVAQSGSNANAGGGGFPGGGVPPDGGGPGGPGGDGGFPGGGANSGSTSGQTTVQRTPQAGQANRGFGGGMNTMFIDPLIKVLEQRAG